MLLAFGRFDYLGWHRRAAMAARAAVLPVSDAQRATLKIMRAGVAALLFLGKTLIGGGVAHYRADPGNFYGIDLARFLPSNLLRTWHLQLAILWIATAYVGGALFVAGMLSRSEPSGQRRAIHWLFAGLLVVVVGSLLGEWAGLLQWLGNAWFWFGNQGWEYLEIGRLASIARHQPRLLVGLALFGLSRFVVRKFLGDADVPCAERLRLRVAIGAKEPQVLGPVVIVPPVDVINLKPQWRPTPLTRESTHGALNGNADLDKRTSQLVSMRSRREFRLLDDARLAGRPAPQPAGFRVAPRGAASPGCRPTGANMNWCTTSTGAPPGSTWPF